MIDFYIMAKTIPSPPTRLSHVIFENSTSCFIYLLSIEGFFCLNTVVVICKSRISWELYVVPKSYVFNDLANFIFNKMSPENEEIRTLSIVT